MRTMEAGVQHVQDQVRFGRIGRRDFLKILIPTLFYLAMEARDFAKNAEISKKIRVQVRTLETTLLNGHEEFFFIQTADMHIGGVDGGFFNPLVAAEVVENINTVLLREGATRRNTMIIDTGDVVSSSAKRGGRISKLSDVELVFKQLSMIPADFRIAVPGNHDISYPEKMRQDLIAILARHGYLQVGDPRNPGICVINDIGGIKLPLGIIALPDRTVHKDWYDSRYFKEDFLNVLKLRGIMPRTIVATHNASVVDCISVDILKELNVFLLLAGHTHGGQIGDHMFLQRLMQDIALGKINYESFFINGLYKLFEEVYVHVSSGMGHSKSHGPRTVPPSVTIFKVVNKPLTRNIYRAA